VPKKNTAQGHVTHPPHGPQKVAVAKTGHVNYTAMEDILEGESVLTGMFSLNGHSIVVPFDSGATHDFISKTCTQKCQLMIELISTPYVICTLGGIIATKQLGMAAPLNLASRLFKTNLIVLEGQGIDVILGIGWMKGLKAILDITARTVQLESPIHGKVVLQLPSSTPASLALHSTAAQNIEDIPITCKFPDVFPEDLPGMPPDRDVEFTIEQTTARPHPLASGPCSPTAIADHRTRPLPNS
jgi:hypothetical protein